MTDRRPSGASARARSPETEPPPAGPAEGEAATGGPVHLPGRGHVPAPDPLVYVAAAGLFVAAAAAAAELVAGPGTRMGWWRFPTGFAILRFGAYGGLAAIALSVVAGIGARPGRGGRVAAVAAAALVVGVVAAGVPWSFLRVAASVPAIHDITTDTDRPPGFAALLPLRLEAPNGAEYGGPAVAAKQRAAYPDVKPAHLAAPPDAAFDRALAAAQKMGWTIAAADRAGGRIEATATTFWFGFKDDVVVRVAPEGTGSRVDVRSMSRVGRSDLGTNARRIRNYLKLVAGTA